MRIENFLPKDIYEARFAQVVPSSQESTYKHGGKLLRGIMLPLFVPIVEGVVEISSISSAKVKAKSHLPVADMHVDAAFKDAARTLTPKPKAMQDAGKKGGDGKGNYIQARMSAGTRRSKCDSDDSDIDPMDLLWGRCYLDWQGVLESSGKGSR